MAYDVDEGEIYMDAESVLSPVIEGFGQSDRFWYLMGEKTLSLQLLEALGQEFLR